MRLCHGNLGEFGGCISSLELLFARVASDLEHGGVDLLHCMFFQSVGLV